MSVYRLGQCLWVNGLKNPTLLLCQLWRGVVTINSAAFVCPGMECLISFMSRLGLMSGLYLACNMAGLLNKHTDA